MTDQPAISFKAVRADLPAASGVAIHGEVDVAAVPALEGALEAAIETSAGGFVVDLSGVEFMDSSGLLAMLNARGLLAARIARWPWFAPRVPFGSSWRWRACRSC